jgi:parvulin-like peptidyl-prolyl isomerase
MKRFPWRFALYFALSLWLALDLYVLHGPVKMRLASMAAGAATQGGVDVVARVYGRAITKIELQRRLRQILFLRGEDWTALSEQARDQLRQLAMEELIDQRLVTAFRTMNGLDAAADTSAVEPAVQSLLAELKQSPGGEKRLADQLLSLEQLESSLKSDALDSAWLEQKIAHRMAEVTESTARAWFDENLSDSMQPERWLAAHIFLSGHEPLKDEAGKVLGTLDRSAEMTAIHDQLRSGSSSWEALCQRSEDERSKGHAGQLGWFTESRMPADFIAHLRKLKPGETSTPVQTKLGWHLLKLEGYQPAQAMRFEEEKAEVLLRLRNERRLSAMHSLMKELRQRAVAPTPFVFRFPSALQDTEPR